MALYKTIITIDKHIFKGAFAMPVFENDCVIKQPHSHGVYVVILAV
jgi:hypothetical protein